MGKMNGDYQAFLKEARFLLEAKLFKEALALADRCIGYLPGDVDAHVIRAHALSGLGRHEDAKSALQHIEAFILRLATEAEMLSRKLQEAEAIGRQTNNPSEPCQEIPRPAGFISTGFYTVTLAELYIRQGHLDNARDVLEAILKENPAHETASFKLGEVQELLKKEREKQRRKMLIDELSRWLTNVKNSAAHAS
jgi:tetratricopeptide (TPR) repeat protein